MNWVEQRYQKPGKIDSGSGAAWKRLSAAMKEAIKSYNTRYAPREEFLITEVRLGHSLRLSKGDCSVWDFYLNGGIVWSKELAPRGLGRSAEDAKRFIIDVDEEDHLFWTRDNGKRMSDDEASEALLKPILFPSDRQAS